MKSFVFSFFLVFLSLSVFSQESDKKSGDTRYNIAQFKPLGLFDFFNPAFYIGYERIVGEKISIRGDYGRIMKNSILGYIINAADKSSGRTNGISSFSGNYFGLEIKRWINEDLKKPRHKKFSKYISIEPFYLHNKTRCHDDFIVVDASFDYPDYLNVDTSKPHDKYNEWFVVDKTRIGVNLKFGMQIQMKQLLLSWAAGIGVQKRKAVHSERVNLNDTHKPILIDDPNYLIYNRAGDEILLNVPIDFSIGYRFL